MQIIIIIFFMCLISCVWVTINLLLAFTCIVEEKVTHACPHEHSQTGVL